MKDLEMEVQHHSTVWYAQGPRFNPQHREGMEEVREGKEEVGKGKWEKKEEWKGMERKKREEGRGKVQKYCCSPK